MTMTIATPPVQPVRVLPLWKRSELFREPAYTPGTEWDAQDVSEDDDTEESMD
jgi:hypothetical protein